MKFEKRELVNIYRNNNNVYEIKVYNNNDLHYIYMVRNIRFYLKNKIRDNKIIIALSYYAESIYNTCKRNSRTMHHSYYFPITEDDIFDVMQTIMEDFDWFCEK